MNKLNKIIISIGLVLTILISGVMAKDSIEEKNTEIVVDDYVKTVDKKVKIEILKEVKAQQTTIKKRAVDVYVQQKEEKIVRDLVRQIRKKIDELEANHNIAELQNLKTHLNIKDDEMFFLE